MSEQAVTWAACLTPPGAGAIATIAVRGPEASHIARSLFRPLRAPSSLPQMLAPPDVGLFWLGRFGDSVADEVVLAVRRVTPDPWLEIHCHGGHEAVRLILETLASRGVQTCSWQELERRTSDQPWRAEAAAELVKALTARTAAILLDQYHGAFERVLEDIHAALDRDDSSQANALLASLARHIPVGRHLTRPWRVAVIGAPNVGKSSLVNALAGFPRCVVSAIPGTTRDVVTTTIAVDGWPVDLADTAGLRDQTGSLEEQGIGRARTAAASADLCLWLLDASAPPIWPVESTANARFIVNKVDLPAAWDVTSARDALHVSARTGAGLAELCQALAKWLAPEMPSAGAAVPFTPAWCDRIEECQRLLEGGRVDEVKRLLRSPLAA